MNSDGAIRCWRCGITVAPELLPLRREEVCAGCNADLHVCRLCRFFNPSVSDGCDEPVAGGVTNKERANFCDYFKPSAHAWRGGEGGADAAARARLDALFGASDSNGSSADPAADSAAELERLFGLDKDPD